MEEDPLLEWDRLCSEAGRFLLALILGLRGTLTFRDDLALLEGAGLDV